MKTCLQVHNDYLIPGGETKSAKLIADLLEKKGIRVIRYYKDNSVLQNVGATKKIIAGLNSIYSLTTIKEVEEIIKREHVDFALIHNTSPIISNSIYAVLRKHQIKVYKYLQNYNLLCMNGAMDKGEICEQCLSNSMIGVRQKCYKESKLYTFQKYIAKEMLWEKYIKDIDGFIAISEFVKEKHVHNGLPLDKVEVLYHFCEKAPAVLAKKNEEKYVVYMGRLSKEKGIMTLIKAMERNQQINLKILGTGPMEKELKQFVANVHISNVHFLGYKTGVEKDEIIGNAIALIAPSEWEEPFGRIVIEAYQVGTPVIASVLGGLKELVEEGRTGFRFKAGNVEELEACISRISSYTEEELYELRRNCVNLVEKKFTEEAYFNNFCSIMKWENNG